MWLDTSSFILAPRLWWVAPDRLYFSYILNRSKNSAYPQQDVKYHNLFSPLNRIFVGIDVEKSVSCWEWLDSWCLEKPQRMKYFDIQVTGDRTSFWSEPYYSELHGILFNKSFHQEKEDEISSVTMFPKCSHKRWLSASGSRSVSKSVLEYTVSPSQIRHCLLVIYC